MDQLAGNINTIDLPLQEIAFVRRTAGSEYIVETDHCTCRVRQAASCLLKPQPGDKVLLVRDGDKDGYILAVLEREDNAASELAFDGGVHIKVRKGRLSVTSQEGMDIASAGDMKAVSEKLTVNAIKGRFGVHDLMFRGGIIHAQMKKIKWLAGRVDAAIESLYHRTRRSYRTIDDFEQVRAGRMDVLVKKLLSFRSKYTILTSKEDVKVDGERIHIG